MTKSTDTGQDLVGSLRPHEGLGIFVVPAQVGHDRVLKSESAAVSATLDLLLAEQGEPALDQVEPGRACWREVQVEPRMTHEPATNASGFVRAIVVED